MAGILIGARLFERLLPGIHHLPMERVSNGRRAGKTSTLIAVRCWGSPQVRHWMSPSAISFTRDVSDQGRDPDEGLHDSGIEMGALAGDDEIHHLLVRD